MAQEVRYGLAQKQKFNLFLESEKSRALADRRMFKGFSAFPRVGITTRSPTFWRQEFFRRKGFPDQFQNHAFPHLQVATPLRCGSVVLAALPINKLFGPLQIAKLLHLVKFRIKVTGSYRVAVVAQLLDHPQTVDGLLTGMMENVQLDEVNDTFLGNTHIAS
jgi:hypothetical protein